MNSKRKPVLWVGASYREIMDLPPVARHAAGDSLRLVQQGKMPPDWKPMEQVGAGAC